VLRQVLAACASRPIVLGLSTEQRLKPRVAALAAALAATPTRLEGGAAAAQDAAAPDCVPLAAAAPADLSASADGAERTALTVPLALLLEGAPLAPDKFDAWLRRAPARAAAAQAKAARPPRTAKPPLHTRPLATRPPPEKPAAPNAHAVKWQARLCQLEAFRAAHGHCRVGAKGEGAKGEKSTRSSGRLQRNESGGEGGHERNSSSSRSSSSDNGDGDGDGSPEQPMEQLSKWVTRQRWLRRKSLLTPDREAALSALGFEWEKGPRSY
jgi:hypothetical protein